MTRAARAAVVKRRRRATQDTLGGLQLRYNRLFSYCCALVAQSGDHATITKATQELLLTGMRLHQERDEATGDITLALVWPEPTAPPS